MPPKVRVDPRAAIPREALAFLKRKRLQPSGHWYEVWREAHATAFTVAQTTGQLDVVDQIHRGLQRALRQGETLETFRGRLGPELERLGWTPPAGRGGDVPRRLRRIYDTNLRSAHAAGQWDRIQRTQELLPYLVYRLGPSEVHRAAHAAWAGVCLPVGDPWWSTHYPPNGWGCKCYVQQVAEPPDGAITRRPKTVTTEWTRPGATRPIDVPKGIDPGWDYNAAQHSSLGLHQGLVDRIARRLTPGQVTPGRVRHLRRFVAEHVEGPGFSWFVERSRGASKPPPHLYGRTDKATPLCLLAPSVQRTTGLQPLAVMSDWAAGKQYWSRQWTDAALYTRIQHIVDTVTPVRRVHRVTHTPSGRAVRWRFTDADGWTVVFEDVDGRAALLTYHNRAGGRTKARESP